MENLCTCFSVEWKPALMKSHTNQSIKQVQTYSVEFSCPSHPSLSAVFRSKQDSWTSPARKIRAWRKKQDRMSSHHTPHHVGATPSEVHVWQDNQDINLCVSLTILLALMRTLGRYLCNLAAFRAVICTHLFVGLDLSHAAKDRLPGHSGACHAGQRKGTNDNKNYFKKTL
jgi:hypothetical protein